MAADTQLWDILNGRKARFSRITASGAPDYANAKGSVELCCSVTVALEPQFTSGTTVTRNGSCVGKTLNTYIGADQRTGLKAKVTFGEMSLPVLDLLGDATVGTTGAGFYPATTCATTTGVDSILEVWGDLTHCNTQIVNGSSVPIYARLILPWCYGWKQTSGYSFGPDYSPFEYECDVKPNPNFGIGPFKDLSSLSGASPAPVAGWDHYIYWDTTAPAACAVGYTALPAAPP